MGENLSQPIGSPAVFADDYFFNAAALPSTATLNSPELRLNNSLGSLRIVGVINGTLTLSAAMTIKLQYKSGNDWIDDVTLFSGSSTNVLAAGQRLVDHIPVPSPAKEIYRLSVTTGQNASSVTFTANVQYQPQ